MLENPADMPASGTAISASTTCDSSPPATSHIDSHQLLRGRRELVIDHSGQQYRLRLTRNDKLILTK